jgi:hypothetical protein
VNNPFPPPPLHCHCAVMLTSLSHHKPPPRSPSEPPDTAPSSAPTPGAPSTPLPVPSAAPLLHHCHSPPHGLRHRGTPALMSPPLSSTVNPVHHPIGLLSGHSTAGRLDFAGKSPVLMGEKTSPGAASGLKTEVGRASPIRMGRATIEAARMNSDFCYFSFELIQFIPNQIQISEFHRNLFICQ